MPSPEWAEPERVLAYRERAGSFPHRIEGEKVLLAHVPRDVKRVLDLGTGDGRLLDLLRAERPGMSGVGLDFSAPMLAAARERFAGAAGIRTLDAFAQVGWLREIGFEDADCYWKWLELALLIGVKPAA